MELDLRDRETVDLVARFNQLSSNQIHFIVFKDSKSHTPTDRTLRRLVEQRYLARIERRVVGGAHGGSGQYVYCLGSEGHRLYRVGRYTQPRAISYHSLAIADSYATLVRLERDKAIKLVGYSTEPDCHQTIGRFDLKPDLFVEYQRVMRPGGGRLMLEIDMATQGQRQIMGKFQRYWGALQVANKREWPDNQVVLFVAVNDARAAELIWLRNRLEPDAQTLFKVTTGTELYTSFSRQAA